jgi:hypothetical protein
METNPQTPNILGQMTSEIEKYGIDATMFTFFISTLELNIKISQEDLASIIHMITESNAPMKDLPIERIKKTAMFGRLKTANEQSLRRHIRLMEAYETSPQGSKERAGILQKLTEVRAQIQQRVREMVRLEQKIARIDEKMPEFKALLHPSQQGI